MTENTVKDNATAAGLDQIREILIGQYAKQSDERQGFLEERLDRDVSALREALLKQVASTEEALKRELAAQAQKIDELTKRIEALTQRKVERRDLAGMFTDLAARLGDDGPSKNGR